MDYETSPDCLDIPTFLRRINPDFCCDLANHDLPEHQRDALDIPAVFRKQKAVDLAIEAEEKPETKDDFVHLFEVLGFRLDAGQPITAQSFAELYDMGLSRLSTQQLRRMTRRYERQPEEVIRVFLGLAAEMNQDFQPPFKLRYALRQRVLEMDLSERTLAALRQDMAGIFRV